jgi:hypothetical protein
VVMFVRGRYSPATTNQSGLILPLSKQEKPIPCYNSASISATPGPFELFIVRDALRYFVKIAPRRSHRAPSEEISLHGFRFDLTGFAAELRVVGPSAPVAGSAAAGGRARGAKSRTPFARPSAVGRTLRMSDASSALTPSFCYAVSSTIHAPRTEPQELYRRHSARRVSPLR